jgi:hypothetical protein
MSELNISVIYQWCYNIAVMSEWYYHARIIGPQYLCHVRLFPSVQLYLFTLQCHLLSNHRYVFYMLTKVQNLPRKHFFIIYKINFI